MDLFVKNQKDPDLVRNKMTTIRFNKIEEEFIQAVMEFESSQKTLGSNPVTKTEALKILLKMGIDYFMEKHGDPRVKAPTKKKKK